MTLLSTVYTTQAEMERYVGADAIMNWCDHEDDEDFDINVLHDAINEATGEINLTAGQLYQVADLATDELIRRWATILACCSASSTRGNEPPMALFEKCEKVHGWLERVASGEVTLNLPLVGDHAISLSNRQIDRRYEHSTVRVTKPNSTEVTTQLSRDFLLDQVRSLE